MSAGCLKKPPKGEASAQRVKVRGEQRQLRSRSSEGLDDETVGNALFVEMNEDQVAAVAATAVRSVGPPRPHVPALPRSCRRIAQSTRSLESTGRRSRRSWHQGRNHRHRDRVKLSRLSGFLNDRSRWLPQDQSSSDIANTNSKVIVARSYVNLLPTRASRRSSARDRVGHGTALAMIVAGTRTTAPARLHELYRPQGMVRGTTKCSDHPSNDSAVEDRC